MGSSSRELRMGSAGTKVLSILMALVLAIGLMPMPKQAYAIESTPLATGDDVALTLNVTGALSYNAGLMSVGTSDWGLYAGDDEPNLKFDSSTMVASAKEGSTYQICLDTDSITLSDYDITYKVTETGTDTESAEVNVKYQPTNMGIVASFEMPSVASTLTINFATSENPSIAKADATNGTFVVHEFNGSATADITSAAKGSYIGVTPTANEGYRVSKVTYSYSDGTQVVTKDATVNSWSGAPYYFTMPDADVTVAVTFEADSSDTAYSLGTLTVTNPGSQNMGEKDLGATINFQVSGLTAAENGKSITAEIGSVYYQPYLVVDGDDDVAMNEDRIGPASWNDIAHNFTYNYQNIPATIPDDLASGSYSCYVKAVWVIDDEDVATTNSAVYTFTIANEGDDEEEGDYTLTLDNSDTHGVISASIAHGDATNMTKFSGGDTITITASDLATGYVLDDVTLYDTDGYGIPIYSGDGAEVSVEDNVATIEIDEWWEDVYGHGDLTVVPAYKDTSAAKYAVTADSSLVGGSISFGDYATEVAAGEGTSFIVTADLGYTIGEVTAYQTDNPTETVNVGFSGNGIYTIMSMPSHDVTVSATFVKGKIDLGDSRLTVKRFDGESYVYTGAAQDAMTPSFKNIPAGFTAPVLNQDYTISITQDGKEVVLKEFGTYTITLKATETSAEYTGTRTGTIYVTPYFTVYVQNGADATPVEAKQYTEAQFKELASDSSDYVSALYWKDDAWNVSTAKTYVTLADLLDNAGISDKWVSGSSIKYGTSNEFTYDTIAECSKFYPRAEAASSANVSDVRDAPLVFALEEYSSAISGSNDAEATEKSNADNANTNKALRTIFGISESQYAAKSAAGSRLWDKTTSITIVTEDSTDEEKIDLGGSDIKKVKHFSDEKYGETGEVITPLVPEFTFASALPEGWASPVLGEDYTLSFEQDGKEVDLKERGTYTIKMTATDKSAHYKGTRTGTVEVTAYFTVYVQKGSDGAAEVKKEFSKGDFTSLKSDSTQPVSALFYKNNIWRVATAATYVTLDEVLSAAGVSGEWVSGAALKYDGGTFSYDVLAECSNFYPHAAGANSDDKSDVRKAPFVFALTGASSDTSASVDAAAAEAANVAAANDSAAPRSIFGISEKQYADRNAMGSRLWDKLTSVTIITAEAPAKQANPIKVTGKSVEKTYSTSKQTIALKDALTVTGNQGAVTYEKVADKTSITVAADGVITLPAKLAAGKYTVKVKATAAGNDSYESGTAEATVTVTVKPVTVKAPTAVTGLTYSGKAQTGVKGGTGYTVTNGSKTDAGSYTATVKLSDARNYTWTDGKTDAKSIRFTIARAQVAVPTAKSGLKYNGKSQVAVKAATGYTVKNGSATNAGSYKATATLDKNHAWKDGSTSAKTISYKIAKIANTLSASAKAASVKLANVKKKAQTVTALTVKGAQGKVTYKKASGDKKLTVASNGKVTVAKGTKKGTYKASVKVTAAGNGNYNSATKTVTVKVTVK